MKAGECPDHIHSWRSTLDAEVVNTWSPDAPHLNRLTLRCEICGEPGWRRAGQALAPEEPTP